jgi:hypothetical protein
MRYFAALVLVLAACERPNPELIGEWQVDPVKCDIKDPKNLVMTKTFAPTGAYEDYFWSVSDVSGIIWKTEKGTFVNQPGNKVIIDVAEVTVMNGTNKSRMV